MFDYFAILVREFNRTPIYAIGLFSFASPKKAVPTGVRMTCCGLKSLDHRFHGVQLNRLNWRKFRNAANPVAVALLAKMNVADAELPEVKLACARMLAKLDLDDHRLGFLAGFMDRYLKLNAEQEREFEAMVDTETAEEKESIMQLVNNWQKKGIREGRKEGRKEGMAKGREVGRQEGLVEGEMRGQARLACALLTRRLGALDKATRQRIESLSSLGLQELGEALMDFTTLADLRAWLAARAS